MKNRYPTTEELYALELEARRVRAVETARLLRAGAGALKSLYARAVAVLAHKVVRHA